MRRLRSGTRYVTRTREMRSEKERAVMKVLVIEIMVGLERTKMVRLLPMMPRLATSRESQPLTM